MPIQHITELFALDGPKFIAEAYRNLLQHDPDLQGMNYYLGRLAQGHSKDSVILQLSQSAECRPHHEILGLEALIKTERRAQHWFWGWVIRSTRTKREIQLLREALAAEQSKANKIEDKPIMTRDSVRLAYLSVLGREPENEKVVNQYLQCTSDVGTLYQILLSSDEYNWQIKKGLNAEVVKQAYIMILGREPETEKVVNDCIQIGDREALYLRLLSSEEFRQRLKKNSDSKRVGSPNIDQLTPHVMRIYQALDNKIQQTRKGGN
ncbi:DUF4214 domain-containing protein [Acidithiobacillus montserratensis]|uniref:DUF4214 domain-containing protein n=1 Tax=Acidithiobacillus montserratensis TaxID=2729135 RepID=A0ACD5HGV3_9PROT|nr:DUF4214 domain-containing protein [Acidithiobacillus montserratensis]MBN2679346.1 DUF4214 domain-containing protein [Acidithiobacillaceae bacterium]MBU2747600.1 DUF4214 domain-containing protein [Acidithiobacillus montserratensis]